MKGKQQVLLLVIAGSVFFSDTSLANEAAKTPSAKTITREFRASEVLAEVNGHKITTAELNKEIKQVFRKNAPSLSKKNIRRLRKDFLLLLIDRFLLVDAAIKKGFQPQNEKLENTVSLVKARIGRTSSTEDRLKTLGLDDERLRALLIRDLAVRTLLHHEVFAKLNVTSAELETAFAKLSSTKREPEVCARHILFRVPKNADQQSETAIRLRAESVLAQAQLKDANFAALARKYSEAANRSKGGYLPWFRHNHYEASFSDVAFSLAPKQIAGPVRSSVGYHLIRLIARRTPSAPSFEENKENLEQQLLQEKADSMLLNYLQQLRSQAKIIIYLD